MTETAKRIVTKAERAAVNFDLYKAGNMGLAVGAGTDKKKLPPLPAGASWKPVSNGQNVTNLRGWIGAPSQKEVEEPIKKQGYCVVKWPGERILKAAP